MEDLFVRKRILYSLIILLLLFISGCGQQEQKSSAGGKQDEQEMTLSEEQEKQQFPRTIQIDGNEVVIEKEPINIAVLSLSVAEVAVDLVGPEKIAVITNSAENENLSQIADKVDEIPNKIIGATSLDPELILSYDPDLVLLTLTHGSEQDANNLLEKAGVPIVSFNQWSTIQDLIDGYKIIGQLLGAEDVADRRIKEMNQKVENIQQQVLDFDDQPSVLLLSQVGPNTGAFILGPTSIAYDIVKLAGGTPASDLLELERTTPASIEHIINLDPDYIILVEWDTASDEFAEMIDSPGFQTLQAVQEDRVMRIPAKDISQPNYYILDRLEELANWIHGTDL